MKRFLLYLLVITTIIACSKSDDVGGGNNNNNETPKQPEITLNATASNFATNGGSNEITFTSSAAWTAEVINSRADAWCTVNPTSGAAGDAKINVTTTANDTPDDRSASIVIKAGTVSKTITVNQKQKDALTVTASKFEVEAEGGEVAIEVKANIDFEYSIEESAKDWVEYKTTRALKTSNLVFEVKENDDTDKREAKITIKSGEFSEVVTIYQAGAEPTIVISQNEYVVSSDGETIAVEVASNVDVTIELPTEADWVTENTTRGVSTNTFYFDIAPSEEYDQRTAEIKFTNKENNLSEVVKITQMQVDAIVLAMSEYEFGTDGGNLDFEIQTNVDVTVTISDDAKDWIQQVETRALETKTLYFNVSACSEGEEREGTITISGGNATQTITVKQSGLKETLKKEREALIAFYNATGGDNWTRNDNWCSDKPVAEWYGVTTLNINGSNFISKLDLHSNNLSGAISGELDGLQYLYELYIYDNSLESIALQSCPNLSYLHCHDNQLQILDVSNCAMLVDLWCMGNHIQELNVNDMTGLARLVCYNNQLQTLNVSNCPELLDLNCQYNHIQELNIANATKLHDLKCGNNQLQTLDVSNCAELVYLWCSDNSIQELDVASMVELKELYCGNNSLNSLDVSSCYKLETFWCSDNRLQTLDVSNCAELRRLVCDNNQLQSLDMSNCTELVDLYCHNNELQILDVSNCAELENLSCWNNHIQELNVAGMAELEELICDSNSLNSLDVSNCYKLKTLWCSNNQLTQLVFYKNDNLKEVLCHFNNLAFIELSQCPALEGLWCHENMLTSLDVSKLTELRTLWAGNYLSNDSNQLQSLDLSKNAKLEILSCYGTNLSTIDVSNCPELVELEVSENNISLLDLGKNTKLKELWADSMKLTELDVSYSPQLEWLTTLSNADLYKIYITPEQQFSYTIDSHTQFAYKGDEVTLYESTDYSKDGEVKQLLTATKGDGIDLVLMGDAYSDRLIADGTYDQTMQTAMEKFFEVEPYKSFRDYFNVYSVTAVSKNEVYNLVSSTAFAGYFGAETLVGGNDQRAFYYAQQAIGEERMDDALVVVLMNSTEYAGTCYMYSPTVGDWGDGVSVSYFPVGEDSESLGRLIHHEAAGHGFSKLGDEYAYENMGAISQSEITSARAMAEYGWWKNVDFTNDPTQVKWSRFLADSRYAYDGLGVYEGAFTYWTGTYRPTMNSIMNANVGGFNAPSREAIYFRIHKLAYGEDWEYDYEEFVEWDAKNRVTSASTRGIPYRLDIPEDFKPTHPPVVMKNSWRNAKNNAPKKATTNNGGNAGSNLQKVSTSKSQMATKPATISRTTTSYDGSTEIITTDESGMITVKYSKMK